MMDTLFYLEREGVPAAPLPGPRAPCVSAYAWKLPHFGGNANELQLGNLRAMLG